MWIDGDAFWVQAFKSRYDLPTDYEYYFLMQGTHFLFRCDAELCLN